jgi:hypothetical protein
VLVGLLPLVTLVLAPLAPSGTVIAMLATKFFLRELFAFLLRGLLTLLDLLGVLLRFLFGLILQLVEVASHGPSIPAAAAPGQYEWDSAVPVDVAVAQRL